MQDITVYNFNEIIALVTSVLIGTGAYVAIVNLKKREKISISFITSVLFINLFVTYVISEIFKNWNLGEYRAFGLPLVAYGGQYLLDWVDKRYLKIFDAGAKKIGLDINNENIENEENYETDDYNEKGDTQ